MQKLRFIFECNSSYKLDAFTKVVIDIIKSTGAVKSGPVCFNGKRLVDCYNANNKTIDRLMHVKPVKGVIVLIEQL